LEEKPPNNNSTSKFENKLL